MAVNAHAPPHTPPMFPPSDLDLSQQWVASPEAPKPNILYIMADQLAAPLLQIYNAKSQIKTPNLDALASEAVVFNSAYCASPLCAPARMAMVTGQLPSKIGAYDNATSIGSEVPTYAHYLRTNGYETVLAGKMHFVGEQLHGFESRLTPDIYPGDYGWVPSWDEPDRRLEWYHNSSSILQAGPCVRSNQLDFDEEVMYKSKQYLYDHVRQGTDRRPFCLTVSLTHPHDPWAITDQYWNLYEDVDIELPKVNIDEADQDPHSKRLLHVCDLENANFSKEQVRRARRAYYAAVSYVDDCVGEILAVLKQCRLDDNTIIIFGGDHGEMLGERGLWYKMSFFEPSARVPLLVHYPKRFAPHRVDQNVSTMDLLPTLVDLVSAALIPGLPLDGQSLLPHLLGNDGHDAVFGEYAGEGTIAPIVMIRRDCWKFVFCPADPPQLFNLADDPQELKNLAESSEPRHKAILQAYEEEAQRKWDFTQITRDVLLSQRRRRFVWSALKQGRFESWDYQVPDDSRTRYIRSHIPLDELELKARYPPVDSLGKETTQHFLPKQAGAIAQ